MLHFALCMSMYVCLEIKIFVFVYDMCGYVMFAKYWKQHGKSLIAIIPTVYLTSICRHERIYFTCQCIYIIDTIQFVIMYLITLVSSRYICCRDLNMNQNM